MGIKYPVYTLFFKGNERKYVIDCLDSTWISSRGSCIEKFERSFAEYTEAACDTSVNKKKKM